MTDRAGTRAGQCAVSQIRSSPEVTSTWNERASTSSTHAVEPSLPTTTATGTSVPAGTGPSGAAATPTSSRSGVHAVGCAATGGFAAAGGSAAPDGALDGAPAPFDPGAAGWVAEGVLFAEPDAGVVAGDRGLAEVSGVSPSDDPAACLSRSAAFPLGSPTSSQLTNQTTRTTGTIRTDRRAQYTRAGSGPTGRSRGRIPPQRSHGRRSRRVSTPYDRQPNLGAVRMGRCGRMPTSPFHAAALTWYAQYARDLPWRQPDATPWGVLVSEVMLQQTPVSRVLPAYAAWISRWPTPASLADDAPGEAIRQWGRLGYPRRALRLHAAAASMVARHGGAVPSTFDDLRALPGVGDYTAAAVASFAFRQRHVVLDTNVRRVLARLVDGVQYPPTATTAHERRTAESLLPDEPHVAATWAVAVMEVGALVCTAGSPACDRCPFRRSCRWRIAGRPAYDGPPRRRQRYEGTDRQCRGRLLQVLRDGDGPATRAALDAAWADPLQRARALDTLVADGLVEPLAGDLFRLPTG